jgi:alkylation response protein AidB-like acyl-CoA dehydrogenase
LSSNFSAKGVEVFEPEPALSSTAKWYCAEVLEIFEGSKEIQKVIIGKKMLGMI